MKLTHRCRILQPTLPVETFGVIAELLAGVHALKTLASLSTASHAIHDVTLPVLYETVLCDRSSDSIWPLRLPREIFPEGYRFTKSVHDFLTQHLPM